jgi:transposase
MLYVGIDVAKSKHDCCILNGNGEALSTFVIKNNKQGFEELIAEITKVSSTSDL